MPLVDCVGRCGITWRVSGVERLLTPTLTRTQGTGEFSRNAQLEDESFGWAHLGGETPDG
jgi:hypothetical protein